LAYQGNLYPEGVVIIGMASLPYVWYSDIVYMFKDSKHSLSIRWRVHYNFVMSPFSWEKVRSMPFFEIATNHNWAHQPRKCSWTRTPMSPIKNIPKHWKKRSSCKKEKWLC